MKAGTANTDFAQRGDPKYLEFLTGKANALALQEAKDVVLREHLPEGWMAIQFGALAGDKAKMGSAIAYDSRVYRCSQSYLVLGCRPFWGGQRLGLLTRWICVAVLENKATGNVRTLISAHNAPWRFRVLQPGFKRRLKAECARHQDWVVGTDANEPIGKLGAYLGGHSYPDAGIVGFVSKKPMGNIEVRRWGQSQGFTDHPAVTGTTA